MITVAFAAGAERYDGPLELLLALVRQNQYPMDRLPLGEITRQFTSYVQQSEEQTLELGEEFFETASWLVLLKSRALLPQTLEDEAPEQELARVLLAPHTLRAAAGLLGDRQEAAGIGSPAGDRARPAAGTNDAPQPLAPADVPDAPAVAPTVHDAVLAARRALAVAQAHTQAAGAIPAENYPVEEILAALAQRLATLAPGQGVSTAPWFEQLAPREAQATLLLALLELARLGRVLLGQHMPFGSLLLKRVPAEKSPSRRQASTPQKV